MVPLTGEAEDDSGPAHSATSFFAMPTPKKKQKVDDDPEIVVAPPKAAAPSSGPPPSAPQGMPPGMNPGMPMGGYPMQMGIQGPVAAGPMAAGYGRPAAPDPTPELERAQSMRVFAIVAGLLFLVMSALAVCVVLVVAAVWLAPGAKPPERTVAVAPMPGPSVEPEDEEDVPIPSPQPAAPRPRPSGGTPGPRPAPAPPPPPPPSATGTVSVNIPAGVTFTGIEVSCNDGAFRERGSFVGTTATVGNVPSGVECNVNFKGGFPTKTKARAGQTLNCQFPNNQAFCQ